MLQELNGQTCQVVTGVVIVYPTIQAPGFRAQQVMLSCVCLEVKTLNQLFLHGRSIAISTTVQFYQNDVSLSSWAWMNRMLMGLLLS